jgi:lipopolysaccharide biosynthesis protein
MFWARSRALKPLLDLNLSFDEFAEEADQKDATLAHAIERMYFFSCEKAGFCWAKIISSSCIDRHYYKAVTIRSRDSGNFQDCCRLKQNRFALLEA